MLKKKQNKPFKSLNPMTLYLLLILLKNFLVLRTVFLIIIEQPECYIL